MPRNAIVAADLQVAINYFATFDLDSAEWGSYSMSGRPEKAFDKIVWLVDETGWRDEKRIHYSAWFNMLAPNGKLLVLSIR